jgi:ribonucleoside-triphosphate reductase
VVQLSGILEVRTSEDMLEIFDVNRIINALERESSLEHSLAIKIADRVESILYETRPQHITTSLIRKLVSAELIEWGKDRAENEQTSVSIPAHDILNLTINGSRDNANMIHNPETAHKHIADRIMKEFAINNFLPSKFSDEHVAGNLHIHDLEFVCDRPINCLQHDQQFFIKHGLKVDGTGEHTSVAGSPNHFDTQMNHTGETMLAAQQNMSGGQSMSLWNVFVAPLAKGMTYQQIKQSIEMLIFNLNMAYAARGSQVPFTTINLEFTVPDFMKNEPAFGAKGKEMGVYGDYEEEVRLIQRAFTDVLMKGDAYGKPHLFPNTIYALRKEMMKDEFMEDLLNVHKVAAKFGTVYFSNMLVDYRGKTPHANYMGCRTCLDNNWTGDWKNDTLRTGNFAYITMNLPRLALQNPNEDDFKSALYDKMSIAKEILQFKFEHAKKSLNDYNLMPFLSQDDYEDGMYYQLDNASLSFGFVGLNETLQYLTGEGIDNKDSCAVGVKILEEMNCFAKDIKDGHRWGVLQSPAESTCHRFATMDKKEFGDRAIIKGKEKGHYYTNSSHVPVDSDVLLPDKIKIEEQFHPLTKAGHIFHVFMGEAFPDPEALTNLTIKMAKKSQLGLWAYSSAFSFCLKCHNMMQGLQKQCNICGEVDDVEWYDRITGYVQQVGHSKSGAGGWNAGKMSELMDRKRYTNLL